MQEGGGDWKIKQSHAEEKYGKKSNFSKKYFILFLKNLNVFLMSF